MSALLAAVSALLLTSTGLCQSASPGDTEALVISILDNVPVERATPLPVAPSLITYLLSETTNSVAARQLKQPARSADRQQVNQLLRDESQPNRTDKSAAVRLSKKYHTPFDLQSEPMYLISNDQTTDTYGNYLIMDGGRARFTSPGYPAKYGRYVWTSWTFEAYTQGSTLALACSDNRLGARDYLVVQDASDGPRRWFDRDSVIHDLYDSKITVELRTNQKDHGRIACSVEAVGMTATGTGTGTATSTGTGTGTGTGSVTVGDTAVGTGGVTVGDTGVGTGGATTEEVGVNDRDCGTTNYRLRIVGGTSAPVNAYPWLVAIAPTNSSSPFCGGSIVTERHVLTAAHCVNNDEAAKIQVLVEKHVRGEDDNEKVIGVENIQVHPNYDKDTSDNDLALLKLDASLRELIRAANGRVRSVCLPSASCSRPPSAACFSGRQVTLTGWGLLQSGGSTPSELQHVTLPVVPNDQCGRNYVDGGYDITITSNMICAGLPQGGKDSCQGDSGGPMMVNDDATFVYTQVGIVSFGVGCAEPKFPGVYTRLSQYNQWIQDNARI